MENAFLRPENIGLKIGDKLVIFFI